MIIKAIYEDGVFKPLEPVDLPEGTVVEVFFVQPAEAHAVGQQAAIHETLSRSYDTGQTDTASRHNEHQP